MSRSQLVDARQPDGVSANDPIWNRLREIIRAINGSRVVDGRMLDTELREPDGSGLLFTAGQTRSIPHKLGRRARGWLEIYLPDVASAAHVGLFAVAHPAGVSSEHYVTVKATSAGRCAIWVF